MSDRPTAAILFADISGSVTLYANRGDTVAFDLNNRCLLRIEECVGAHGGHVIKRAGDAVLAEFDGVEPAVRAAGDALRAVDDPASGLREEGVHVRVGISYGTVVRSEGDVYGDRVNVAARLVSLAGAEEILISGPAYEALPGELQEAANRLDEVALRGRPTSEAVFRYLWRADDATVAGGAAARAVPSALRIHNGAESFVVGQARPVLRLGRAPDNDIVVTGDAISRYHAEVAVRGDRFVLKDRSTNGSAVLVDGGPTLRICRDEIALVGSGWIALGDGEEQRVRYEPVSAR